MINARESFPLLPAEEYPWQPVGCAGIVDRHGFTAITGPALGALLDQFDHRLRAMRRPPIERRTPVLAVGSNRAAEVLRTKFGRAGVSRTVPVLPCGVHNLAIGHLAHVSLRGYLAAAPLHRPGARGEMVIGWLDDDQLAAMDDTEPGYQRARLHPDDYPISTADTELTVAAGGIGEVWAYVAQHRLLARRIDGRLEPVLLSAQTELYRLLAEVRGLGDLDWRASPARVAAQLDAVRDRVPAAILASGLTVPGRVIRRAEVGPAGR